MCIYMHESLDKVRAMVYNEDRGSRGTQSAAVMVGELE